MADLEPLRGRFLLSSAQGETLARITRLLDDAQWLCIATGYARTTGLDLLPPRFEALMRAGRVWILSSDQRAQLSTEFVQRVQALHPSALRVVPHHPTLMHAKSWIIQPASPTHTAVLTGSWNLTRSGLAQNDDLGAWLVADSASPEIARIRTWFRERWDVGYAPAPTAFYSEREIGDDEPDIEQFLQRARDRAATPSTPAALASTGAVIATTELGQVGTAPPASPRGSPANASATGAPLPAPFSETSRRLANLARRAGSDPSIAKRLRSIFELRLRDPDSVWTLDLRPGAEPVREGPSRSPDCVVELRDADFQDICAGRAGMEALFFAGRMQVRGDVMRVAGLDLRALTAAERDEAAVVAVPDEDVDAASPQPSMLPAVRQLSLAPFQQEALQALRTHHAAQGSKFVALLALPTGGGKTRIAVWWLLEDFVARGGRVLWIAHRRELIEQARATFEEHRALLGDRTVLRVSYLTADTKDVSGNVVVASTLTLMNNSSLLYDGPGRLTVHAICFDEAHHATADATKKMLLGLRKRQAVPLLGLTATPYRMDAGETTFARDFFEARVAYQKTFGELVAAQFLAEPVWDYLERPTGARKLRLSGDDIAEVRRRNDFTPAVLRRVAGDDEWNAAIVDQWQRRDYGPTIVFASNTDHIRELCRTFKHRAGVNAVGISYESDPADRAHALGAFATGRVPVIVNVGILTEGADIDGVRTVVMARPTLSRILYRQMIGRAARRGRDREKSQFFVLDCVQNSLFHHDVDLHLAGDEVRAELEGR